MAGAPPMRPRRPARGVITIEFALLVGVFLTVVFFVIEVGRVIYLWNTTQEVTRRAAHAAATTDFSDPAAMDLVRRQAIFRTSAGMLPLGAPIDDTYVRIDYLWLSDTGALARIATPPACPARNMLNCLNAPHDPSCVRFVRARLCLPGAGDTCAPVPYQPLMPMLGGFATGALAMLIPTADTVQPAESLGYQPGMAVCP
jgi:hypothetical protein